MRRREIDARRPAVDLPQPLLVTRGNHGVVLRQILPDVGGLTEPAKVFEVRDAPHFFQARLVYALALQVAAHKLGDEAVPRDGGKLAAGDEGKVEVERFDVRREA